ncbi:hypothetical protein DPMN_045217 [Dreissena polymorpha]|uniref:Uncharacterized protein n=1 Tax=Dreissena polymorpha TaxID=45954 RepID=A0A9D4HZF9_DREPO|nr:hypothetical protein DPMN_045217 [Dreissena polymorpha]
MTHFCLSFQNFRAHLQKAGKNPQTRDNTLADVTRMVYKMMVSAYGEGVSPQELKFHTEALTLHSYESVIVFMESIGFSVVFMESIGFSVKTILNYRKTFIKFVKYVNIDMDLQLQGKNSSEYMRIVCLLQHLSNTRMGFNSCVFKQYKREMNSKPLPPTIPDVKRVLGVARAEFDKTMQRIGSMKDDTGTIFTKKMVAFINRIMTAYLCLGQGHRVGAAKNM